MQFRKTNSTTPQPNAGDPFQLSPASLSIHFLQSIQIANRRVDGYRLNIVYPVNNLEIHDCNLPQAGAVRVHMVLDDSIRDTCRIAD